MEPLKAVSGVGAATQGKGATSDAAGAQSLIASADLVLDLAGAGPVTLHSVTPQGNRELGTFDDVRDAWEAVDRIDLKEVEKLLAEERAAAVGIPDDARAA